MNLTFKRNRKPDLIANKFRSFLLVSVLGWLVFLIGEIVDNIFAGTFIGEIALDAVAIVIPFHSFIDFIGILCSVGFGLKFSTLMGRGEKEKAYKVVSEGFFISIISGFILFLIMFFFKKQLLGIFNLTDSVYNYASQYYDWYCGVAFIYPLTQLVYRLALQDGDVRWTFMSDATSVLANIAISAILVRTMGISGLGLGTFISIIVGALVVGVHYFTKRNSVKFIPHFSFKEIGECLKLSSGYSLATLFVAIVDVVMNLFICYKFGDNFLSSYTIINFILNFTSLFLCAPDSVSGLISGAFGAKNNDDFKYCVKLETKWTIIVAAISTILMCALCMVIPSIFGISDPTQYDYSVKATLIIAPTFIFNGLMMTICIIYVAQERALIGVIAETLKDLILPLALSIGFSYCWGYYGLIAGFSLTNIISFLATILILKLTTKSHRIIEYPQVDEYQFSVDSYVDSEGSKKVFDVVTKEFLSHGVSKKELMYSIGLLEDSFNMIAGYNPNKKVTNRLTVGISDNTIRFINKNNGRLLTLEERKQSIENSDNVYFHLFATRAELNWSKLVSFSFVTLEVRRK